MASLYLLREFFKAGRKANGGYMGGNENMENATERNLSLCSEAELLALRDSAYMLRDYIESELSMRIVP